MTIKEILKTNTVIASVKDLQSLDAALTSRCAVIFVLFGNICNIGQIVQKIKAAKKYAFVHIDFLEGASNQEIVVDFLKIVTCADGIISTKSNMIKAAKAHNFYTIHRLFVIDSISYYNIDKHIAKSQPDCIEILPGGMAKVIGWVTKKIELPVIAGGLVCDEEDARAVLKAGAIAVSTTNQSVWQFQ